MKFRILPTSIILLAFSVNAQEFKPYPRANITQVQWTSYYSDVQAKHGATAQDIDAEKLIVFHDSKTSTSYAFTKPEHPAHPAWITRQIYERDGKVGVSQIGYFAGGEEPFAVLFRAYRELNDRIRQNIQGGTSPIPSMPASAPQ